MTPQSLVQAGKTCRRARIWAACACQLAPRKEAIPGARKQGATAALLFGDLHISKRDFLIFAVLPYSADGTSMRAC